LLDTFHLQANVPLVAVDTSQFSIIDQDSLQIPYNAIISDAKSRVYFQFEKTYENTYHIEMLPGLVTDLFGMTNDSLTVDLQTKSPEDYGVLRLEVVGPQESGYVVELLDSREAWLRSETLDGPGIAEFDLINPGNYLVRVTKDLNRNGRWDTGNFLQKRLPEEILFFPDLIEIRANWEKNEAVRFD
jgi:hypothetical protein